MSERRARERRRRERALVLVPTPKSGASEAVKLGLRLRNEASLSGRCACGATAEAFEVGDDGSLIPVERPTSEPGRAFYVRFEHEVDCPATSPALARGLDRGEISDPAGDLLRGFLGQRRKE